MSGLWRLRATPAGAEQMLSGEVVAVNFHLPVDATDLTRRELLQLMSPDPEWDNTSPNVRSSWAGQLANFSGAQMADGDLVLVDVNGRQGWPWLATVRGPYTPHSTKVDQHPHARAVTFLGELLEADLPPSLQAGIPRACRTTLRAGTAEPRVLERLKAKVRPLAADFDKPRPRPRVTMAIAGSWILPSPVPTGGRSPAPTWTTLEHEQEPAPCNKPACSPEHSRYRHLHRIEFENGSADGHDLMVIGFNPNCPDLNRGATFRNVAQLASTNRARSCTVVNLLPARSSSRGTVDASQIPEDRWALNQQVIRDALEDASIVIVAWGISPTQPASQSRVQQEQDLIAGVVDDWMTRTSRNAWKAQHPQVWRTGPALLPWNG